MRYFACFGILVFEERENHAEEKNHLVVHERLHLGDQLIINRNIKRLQEREGTFSVDIIRAESGLEHVALCLVESVIPNYLFKIIVQYRTVRKHAKL